MIDPREQLRGVRAFVRLDAANGDSAESDAVIPAETSDESRARRLALRLEVGHRDLERGIDRFGSRVREEHVVQIARQHLAHTLGEREAEWMPHLEARREVERRGGFLHGPHDRLAAVPGVHAPQSRRTVENSPAVDRRVVHPARRREHARRALERAVGRERHPELLERYFGPEHIGDRGCLSHDCPSELACAAPNDSSSLLFPVPRSHVDSRLPIYSGPSPAPSTGLPSASSRSSASSASRSAAAMASRSCLYRSYQARVTSPASSRLPSPNDSASASATAPKRIANAVTTISFAMPSCCSAMKIASTMTPQRPTRASVGPP